MCMTVTSVTEREQHYKGGEPITIGSLLKDPPVYGHKATMTQHR